MSISYSISSMINKVFKTNVHYYSQLETANNEFDLVTTEGGILTAFEIKGTFGVVGDHSFGPMIESLTDSLSSAFRRPGHRVQLVFRRDPLNSKDALKRSINGAIRTLNHLNIDLVDMINERGNLLQNKTVLESCYLIISTGTRAVHPDILSSAMKERAEKSVKSGGLRPGDMSQSPAMEIPGIDMIHSGFVSQVISRLQETLSIRKLTAHEYLNVLRRQITQYDSSEQWRPYLPGDRVPARLVEEVPRSNDISHLLWPSIAQQLFSREPKTEATDTTIVDIGDWKIAPILVDQRPQEVRSFGYLFSSIDRNVPWQMSLVIDSGHDRVTQLISRKKGFASFIAFISSENKLIREAGEELLAAAINNTMVSAQISFSTWGRDLESARRNKSKLKTAVEAWGQLQVVEERGDAVEAWFNTLPGFSAKHLATPIPMIMSEALTMSPITRPVSPWSEGTMLYRTIDEKAFPYMPGSDLQNAQMELVFAPPGFGKSFYLAAANMGLITRPGNEVLPRIGILDIGFSSAMFVQMVKDSLPNHLKHYAQSFKLEMDARYAVNFFDTPLGCQFPLKVDREFVVNMMTLICTPAGASEPLPRLAELVSNLVDAMYLYFSEEQNPNMYERGMDTEIDKVLDENGFSGAKNGISWWKIVRLLHNAGYSHAAIQAQRFAVPTLNDATTVLSQSSSLRDVYGTSATGQGNETLIDYLKTMIISAVNDYPILSMPTVFSIGDARIVSIDLMSVAREGSAQAEKKTAVMYLLGRQIICREFYRKADQTLPEIPQEFQAYHRKMMEKDEAIPKKFCMDEFHRTSSVPSVRKQAIVDIREGRKYGVHVTLLSQLLEDFDETMIKMVNNVIILSKGVSEMSLNEIKEKFNPSPDAVRQMNRWLTGPGKEGSSMLYIGQLKAETAPRIEQVLRLTLGPIEIWAYSTTPEDVSLRKRLSDRVGFGNALRVLAKAYPNGSAKADIQKILADNSVPVEELEANQNLFDFIVDRLMKEHMDLIDHSKI